MSISDRTNSDKLDSDLLRTFIAIADTGSFTKGADRIFRSQSAASLQIKRLEEILGQPVFERRARGIVLTPTGEKLQPVAKRTINTLDATLGELRAHALTGLLRIGIPDEYGKTILPEVIATFARDHPDVEIEVHCSFSASFPKALAEHEIDLAVYTSQLPIAKGMTLLQREKTHWVCSKNHLVHEQEPVPVALFDRTCWWRDQAIEALEKSARPYKVVYTSESVTGVMAAISSGVAVGLLSESTVGDDLTTLSPAHGFPKMPRCALVLDCADNPETFLLQAMKAVIKQAFR
jgi:DNA-binding transcriptional LysR family regulator